MDFKIYNRLDYDIRKGAVSQKGQFTKFAELYDIVRNVKYTDSFELILMYNLFITKYERNAKPVVIDNQKLDIIVMDELIYPKQVREFLIKNYHDNTFDFDNLDLPADIPVYFGGVLEREELGPINPNTGDKTTYTRRYVQCRSLKDGNIVVGRNLKNIWPYKDGHVPDKLFSFLHQTISCNQCKCI